MASTAETVLVTGASGYVAIHIVKMLLRDTEYNVRGTVRDVDSAKAKSVREIAKREGQEARLELVRGDLMNAEDWPSIVAGCTYVMHVAAALGLDNAPEAQIIGPALNGTLNILAACKEAQCVKRVVITGSIAAVGVNSKLRSANEEVMFDESDWTDVDMAHGYNKAKTLAEKAAWDFIDKLSVGNERHFDLVVILPGLVFGPVLSPIMSSSITLIHGIMTRKMPGLPKVGLPVIDVRDVATCHVQALTNEHVGGKRVIVAGDFMWFGEMCDLLHDEFAGRGYRVATWRIPSALIKFVGWFSKNIRYGFVPMLEKRIQYNNGRMKQLLGLTQPIEPRKSIIEMVESLIEYGLLPKKS